MHWRLLTLSLTVVVVVLGCLFCVFALLVVVVVNKHTNTCVYSCMYACVESFVMRFYFLAFSLFDCCLVFSFLSLFLTRSLPLSVSAYICMCACAKSKWLNFMRNLFCIHIHHNNNKNNNNWQKKLKLLFNVNSTRATTIRTTRQMTKIAVTGSGSRHVYVILWVEIVKRAIAFDISPNWKDVPAYYVSK